MTLQWKKVDSSIVEGDDPQIGDGTRIWHHAHIRAGARIGKNCNIGNNVYVGADCVIGDHCKLQNNVNVYEGVTLDDYVFCGPSMTFTNLSQPLPRAAITRHHLLQKTLVHRGASFGAGSVIVCGTEIGEYAFVAAGAVVIRSIGPFELIAGNPGRVIGHVCVCGGRLRFEDSQAVCGESYEIDGNTVSCERRYALEGGGVRLVEDKHSNL